MSLPRGRSRPARSSPAAAGLAAALRDARRRSSPEDLEQQGGALEEHVQGNEHDQRRERVHARSQEVGKNAQAEKEEGAVLVQPPRVDDAEHAENEQHYRQLED